MSGLVRSVRVLKHLGNPSRAVLSQQLLVAKFSTSLARFKTYPPHTLIDMPALSPTMEAGNVCAWKKQAGDTLASGDVLVEIETDKATMDFEFQDDGFLAKILVPDGTNDVAVGTPIGVFVTEAEDVPKFADFTVDAAKSAPKAVDSSAAASDSASASASASATPNAASNAPTSTSSAPLGRIFISPRAKMVALEKGIKISEVKGTGPNGRIITRDIENFKPVLKTETQAETKSKSEAKSSQPAASAAYVDTPISTMRSVIGKRLRQSKSEAPDFIVSSNVSVSKLMQLRASLNQSSEGAYKISVNDIFIKAIAQAALKVPAANTHWIEKDNVLREYKQVDVSVAVSTPKGLLTPIVSNVESKGLSQISSSVKDLAKRARDNKLLPEEFQGGTITISNMGMNPAVGMFTSIINPPQSTIVAVGAVQRVAIEDPIAESGISFDDVITVTGTFDHRVVDGAVAGEFMKTLKTILENPLQLLL